MTDKIIIDGIDSSKCTHISNFENVLFVCEETGRECEVSKNCYYKQLKRKEQENEELKKSMDVIVEHSRYYKKEYERLTKQTKQLKQVLDKIEKFIKLQCATYKDLAKSEICMTDCNSKNCWVKYIFDIIDKAKEQ